jgi:hypothetical protein
MNPRTITLFTVLLIATSSLPASVLAAPPTPPAVDATVVEARKQFVAGNDLAKAAQWAQALAAFERSAELRPHALTTFNMAVCERALGRLTRAQILFAQTIAAAEHDAVEFPASRLDEARGYQKAIDDELVHLQVHLDPADASLAVDSRALTVEGTGTTAVATAGLGAPGAIEAVPAGTFALIVDPGTHFFRVVAKGYADVTLTKTFAPGSRAPLDLQLSRLPATVRVSSNVADPVVTVDGADVGFAPVAVSRPAGTYRFVVKKNGFDTFDTRLAVLPGQDVDLSAKMAEEKIPLTKRWWFWTGIAATLAGAAVITYAATRPAPAAPPYTGGTTGWVVTPR